MKFLQQAALLITYGLAVTSTHASEQLMEKSGCLSCHRVDQKLIGPAYKDVAARYRNHPEVVDTLMQKVREGGEGVWGDVPMAPNSVEKVSDENLRLIIEWILSLQMSYVCPTPILPRERRRAGRGQLRTQDPFCQEVRLIPFVLSLCSELRASLSKNSLMLLKNPTIRCAAQDERI